MPTSRPRYITAIRSASATTSSSSVETITTAVPRSRSSTSRRCRNSIAPTSTPRVGWLAISADSGRDSSRASTTFCWLPPDSEVIGVVHRLGADVELGDPLLGVAADRGQVERRALGVRRLVEVVEHQVLRHRERADEAVVLAVLGHEAEAVGDALLRGVLGDRTTVEGHRAPADRDQPEQRLGQLGLPVALHAGDADDLAARHLQVEVLDHQRARAVRHRHPVEHQPRRRR